MIVTEREREAETQAEGEAGSMQGARCGIRSGVSTIVPWAEGRRQTATPPRDPYSHHSYGFNALSGFARTTLPPFLANVSCLSGHHTQALDIIDTNMIKVSHILSSGISSEMAMWVGQSN